MTNANTPKNYKGVIEHFDTSPDEVKWYFGDFRSLVTDYRWEASISAVFPRVERAKRMTLYCGIVKLHWCEASVTRALVDREHLSRSRFIELFATIFGKPIPKRLVKQLGEAEAIRDRVVHGSRNWTEADARRCLTDVIDFAVGFNDFVDKQAGFRPFGPLRGFKGRRTPLPKTTTNWVLKGMGFGKAR